MTRARFLHLGVQFSGWAVPWGFLDVDARLNLIAPDWLRYTPNSWLVWTDLTPQELHEALRPVLVNEQYLIMAVDVSAGAQGLFAPFVWDWINRPRDGNWTPPQPRRLGEGFAGLAPPDIELPFFRRPPLPPGKS